MYQTIRWGLAILLSLFIIFLAQQPAAGTAGSPDQSLSAPEAQEQAKAAAQAEDKGTVKPPPGTVLIPVTGTYSVGGFCVLDVVLDDPDITLDARRITPLPAELPDPVHKVRQGCLLTYYSSGEQIPALPPGAGETRICFAAVPDQQTTVYFHNTYSPDPEWIPLETTVEAGIACAPANASGTYIATFVTP